MAFWTRLRQSKPKIHLFCNELKRCCALNQVPRNVNRLISSRTLISDLNSYNFITRNNQLENFCNVRFFAAPVQVNQKKEEKDKKGPRLNEQITSQFIRLVSDEGHSVISRNEALRLAKKLNLDLVEVDRVAKPPACKILDYHKEKYVQHMKNKERAKSKSKTEMKKGPCKEVRFAAKITQKDLQVKADMVKRLIESGHRVKCTAIEPTKDLDLETLLSRFSALIEDVALEESEPKAEKKQAFVVVRHIKFGSPKKGSGKKASNDIETMNNSISNVGVSALTARLSTKNQELEENVDTEEAGWEIRHELDSEELSEDVQTSKSECALDHDDNFNKIFDIKDVVHGLVRDEDTGIVTETSPPSADASSRHALESARVHTASSMPIEVPKYGMENRYARNGNLAKIPTAVNDRGARNTINNVPRNANQGRQPLFSMNASSQMRQPQQLEVHAHETSKQASPHSSNLYSPTNGSDPAARNLMNRAFQVPNQGKQPRVNMNASPQVRTSQQVEVPAYEVPRQDSSHSSIHNTPTQSFGIFGSEQGVTTRHEHSTPAEINRYNKRVPSDSAGSLNTTPVSPYRNSPPSDSRIGRGPGVDQSREGRWGRFSTDSSNMIPNKNESQAEIQRR